MTDPSPIQITDSQPCLNHLVLSAVLIQKSALRYTPAGLPVFDMVLKHDSELLHSGQPRRISLEVKARAFGEITPAVSQLELGVMHDFKGFLGPQRNGRGVVFHVTELNKPHRMG